MMAPVRVRWRRRKTGGRANADSERACHRDHDQVRGGIEHYRNRAQRDELQKDVSASVTDELRDEREKEQRRFWIENFGGDALPQRIPLRLNCGQHRSRIGVVAPSLQDHAHAEKAEIGCAKIFHRGKRDCGLGQNDRESEGSGEHMHHAAEKRAESRQHAFALPSRQASRQNVEHARARRDGQQQRGR